MPATSALQKLERANQHILHLEHLRNTWKEGERERVRFEDDSHSGDRSYYLIDVPPIPEDFPFVLGDAIHNIRTALDHLAHSLVAFKQGDPGPHRHVSFPIAANSKKYKSAETGIKLAGPAAQKAIKAIEPYGRAANSTRRPSGEILWHLHELDIIDKHQLLLTAAGANLMQSMSPAATDSLQRNFLGVRSIAPEVAATTFLTESGCWRFPLKAGDKLATIPKAEVNEHMYFPLEIAFREPQIVARQPVIETLYQMSHFVHNIVMTFDSAGLLG